MVSYKFGICVQCLFMTSQIRPKWKFITKRKMLRFCNLLERTTKVNGILFAKFKLQVKVFSKNIKKIGEICIFLVANITTKQRGWKFESKNPNDEEQKLLSFFKIYCIFSSTCVFCYLPFALLVLKSHKNQWLIVTT